MLTDRFDSALAYASRAHRDQPRKGTAIPYVAHLLAVTAIALEHGADEDQAIAAMLHDVVEDQDVSFDEIADRFGPTVAQIVAHCTDAHGKPKPPWRARKEAYLASLASKPPASLLVSCADKIHNAQSILIDLGHCGEAVWDRFKGGKDGTLWYYRSLADTFVLRMPGPAAERLRAIVEQLELAAA